MIKDEGKTQKVKIIRDKAKKEYIGKIKNDNKGISEVEINDKVKKYMSLWDKYEKIENCYDSKIPTKEFGEILNKIRFLDTENILLIALKEDIIYDFYIMDSGNTEKITLDLYKLKNEDQISAVDFLKKYHHYGVDIYNIHNHPNMVVAEPSVADVLTLAPEMFETDDEFIPANMGHFPTVGKNLLSEIDSDFMFKDWGIVTELDFFLMNKHDKSSIWEKLINKCIEQGII